MNHTKSFLVDEAVREQRSLRREVGLFHLLTILGAMPFGIFGAQHYFGGTMPALGLFEMGTSAALVLNAVLFHFHHRYRISKFFFHLCSSLVLIAILPTGGADGTIIYWLLGLPPTIYVYQGKTWGFILNTFYLLCYLGVFIGVSKGWIANSVYDVVTLRQSFFALLLVSVMSYLGERARELAQNELLDQRRRLQVLLAQLPAGVIMVEPDGRPSVANESAERLLGRSIDVTTLGSFVKAFKLMKEDGTPYPLKDLPLSAALKNGATTVKSDVIVARADGSKVVLRFSGAPIVDEHAGVLAAVSVIEDITKEYEVDKMKSEFISLTSHQLKTPLTGIRWAAESLQDEASTGPLNAGQKEFVSDITQIADRLTRLVTDLLTVSRIETGRKFNLEPKTQDVVPLIDRVAKGAAGQAKERRVSVTTALPSAATFVVDEGKFGEVMVNLVSNAVKYSKEGGSVEIGIASTAKGDAVYVKDSGIGIPEDQKGRIFERFFRAANAEKDIEGTGLGLYIAKSIVEKHGGQLWFESQEGKGTTFFAAFPTRA